MRSKAPAQAEQSQQSTMAQPAAFGQVAERGWQEPAARSPQSGQREARQVNEQPSVLPEEPLGDSVSEPRPETPFGSINNSPRLVDQRQTAVPFSVQRLIQKDNGNGVDLYHGAGWKYDLEAQIRGNAGDGATQGDAGVTEVRQTLASWLETDFVNLEQATADSITWLVQNDFGEPGEGGVDIPADAETEETGDYLNEYGKVYPYQAYTVLNDPTIIPMPRELIKVRSDLYAADAEDAGAFRPDFACVLLSLWPDQPAGNANWANNDDNLTQLGNSAPLRNWLQGQHDAYWGNDVEYDQSPFFNLVLGGAGKSLIYSGETPWSELHEAAGLVAGRDYIIVTDNHCMRINYRGGDDPADAYNVLNFDLNGQRGHQYAAATEVVMVWE